MFALPAAPIIRRRGWVIVAWAALALLFGPRACHVQQVLALRGGGSESTESSRATELLKKAFPTAEADTQDGLRLSWADRWVHVRPSGTEPIVRVIAEAPTNEGAHELVRRSREPLDALRS